MRSYSQNKPTGTGGDADFFQQTLRQLREELQFYDSETIGWRMMPRGVFAYQKNPVFGGQGSGGGTFRGEYDPTASYAEQDVVVIRTGSNSGSFVCIAANSGSAPQLPDIGNLYWVSLSGNVPAGGNWMS